MENFREIQTLKKDNSKMNLEVTMCAHAQSDQNQAKGQWTEFVKNVINLRIPHSTDN
jgi:hypothetical protein